MTLNLVYVKWKSQKVLQRRKQALAQQQQLLPTTETFNKAYNIIQLSSLPSKTKETSFQILNRTIWTNNKAHKSGARENPDCEYCGQAETMEHLIHDCENYSTPLWLELGESLTQTLRTITGKDMAEIRFTPLEIIYNKIHPTIQIHSMTTFQKKSLQKMLNLFVMNPRTKNTPYCTQSG